MPVTVNVNKLSLCHKGSDGITIATAPDVCLTPPGIPVPYPNIAYSADLANGSTTVFADGGNSIATAPSIFSKSIGDEPGTMGGVVSGTFMMEASWITFSADVKIEGQNACRLTDKMLHNHGNTFNCGGEQQPPVGGGNLDCQKMWDEIMKETNDILSHGGDADPITRNRHISAAYAKMYQAHPELKWAGMGAFVSANAGCAMQHAEGMNNWYDPRQFDARNVRDGLAAGNKAIFSDIYPLFAFYAKYGNEAFQACSNQQYKGAPKVAPEMKEAFNLFAKGGQENIDKATMLVAVQEQTVTLQNASFNNFIFNGNMWINQTFSGVGGWAGLQAPDVYMSSQCNQGPTVPFQGSILNPSDRVTMADRVGQAFDSTNNGFQQFRDAELTNIGNLNSVGNTPAGWNSGGFNGTTLP